MTMRLANIAFFAASTTVRAQKSPAIPRALDPNTVTASSFWMATPSVGTHAS
ncbi:MAG: hypothetical protein JNM62_01335 [Flavobacteriales bacterium]|nr:hypothetical protein [Flavobacteriales bacterium]